MIGLSLFQEIKTDLKEVEQELYRYVDASHPVLAASSTHLLQAGGKRLRPAFALLSGKFHNYSLDLLTPLAVALEMIHMATLVHDDVIDCSLTRRGISTVKAKWGDRISLHTGDYLFAKSLILIATYRDQRIARVLADVSVRMCQGEIQQIATSYDLGQTDRDYFYRIKRKTALLISASCQLGALAVQAPEYCIRALKFYGYYLGMAFQITDDILDITARARDLGKPVGNDLRQGILTLPTIYALRESPRKKRLAELLTGRLKTETEVKEAIAIILESGAIDRSFQVVEHYVAKAKSQLEPLPDIPARKTMHYIAEFIKARNF